MDPRGELAPWGAGLDDVRFGRALAALGLWLGSARPKSFDEALAGLQEIGSGVNLYRRIRLGANRWDLGRLGPSGTRPFPREVGERLDQAAPAAVLEQSWLEATRIRDYQHPVRLEIVPRWPDLATYWRLTGLLGARIDGRETHACTSIRANLPSTVAAAQLPIRIGLLEGPRSATFRASVRDSLPWPDLVEWVEVEGPHTPCDLLFLLSNQLALLEPLAALPDHINADCVVLLVDGLTRTEVEVDSILGFFPRNLVDAWSFALVDVKGPDEAWFVRTVIEHWAHDHTLDVAIALAGTFAARPPLLFARPGPLETATVAGFAGLLGDLLPRANGGDMVMVPEAAASLGTMIGAGATIGPGPLDRTTFAQAIRHPDIFLHESDGATTLSRVARDERAAAAARPRAPRTRRITLDVFTHDSSGEFQEVSGPLRPGVQHAVDVSIQFVQRGRLQAARDLDPSLLPHDRKPHDLRVAFQELTTTGKQQTGRIRLQPDGPSTSCRFQFRSPSTGTYRARIIVAYRNRVLQMVRFDADVAGDGPPRRRRPLRIIVEASPRASMNDLAHRRTFDCAFVANHDDQGQARVGLLKEGSYSVFGTSDLKETLEWFEKTLTDLAAGEIGKLESKASVSLLRDLAQRGHDLYEHLRLWRVDKRRLEPVHKRIQLVAGDPTAFFPIEFVYDRLMPEDDAKLCPDARKALRAGACPVDCPAGEDHRRIVCPLGFWCLSRVIERHAFLPGQLDPSTHALLAEPAIGRNQLRVFNGAVYGVSDRVNTVKPGSVALVADALERVLRKSVGPVRTWQEWRDGIKKDSPSTLVLICHTARKTRTRIPIVQLEIGSITGKEWLAINRVEERDVVGPNGIPQPLMFLIGCSTAIQRVQFQNAVARFALAKAAVVLATLATVLGVHAAQVTAALIDEMAQVAARDPQATFGDAMLEVRRRMLADNVFMALALAAFGDADWRLKVR
jgi:hypothetical protein